MLHPVSARSQAAVEAPLFVLSFPRSGTTLLRAMLHGHPELAVLPEPWWMVGLAREVGRSKGSLTRGLATSHLARHVPSSWSATAGLALDDIVACLPARPMGAAEVVAAVGRAYAARFGKRRWGAKYPGVEFRRALPLLHQLFPRATFLFLARDVRDVYLSQVDAGLRPGMADLELYSLLWALQTRGILRDFRRMGERGLVVRYEDLVEDTESILIRICEAAGLESSPAALQEMLDYQGGVHARVRRNPIHRNLQGPVLALNRRKFAARLSPGEIRRAQLVAGEVLARLGYAEPDRRLDVREGLRTAARLPLRLAANVWGNFRGRSTISGMRLRQRAKA